MSTDARTSAAAAKRQPEIGEPQRTHSRRQPPPQGRRRRFRNEAAARRLLGQILRWLGITTAHFFEIAERFATASLDERDGNG